MKNPKILHRVYFGDMPPYRDPFGRFLDTWAKEMPDYKIMHWNASNVDLDENDWVRRAKEHNAPVFLSEYYRWKVLSQYGGMYLDADCEILDGALLHDLIEDVFSSDAYDAALGVEDYFNGHPTAQSVIAKPNSSLVQFMVSMYDGPLSSPLWHWRELRGLIGPQLISLYFIEAGITKDWGMMCHLAKPEIYAKVKVYTQDYFSPKFTIDGESLNVTKNTCVYHLFANLNMNWNDETRIKLREHPMLFAEYKEFLNARAGKTSLLTQPEILTSRILSDVPDAALPNMRRNKLKVLHRIYFGFDGQPDSCQGYLKTWSEQLPDYEIRHWNASNLPMDANDYVRELYAQRDHAFLTDYFRWWVLREHGGIYLDADVEVLSGRVLDSLIDELEDQDSIEAFIGIDEKSGGWYTAHSMAAKPGSQLANFMCRVYEEMGPLRAWRKKAFYLWAPQLTALYFFSVNYNKDALGSSPNIDFPVVAGGVKIYPQDYFSPIAPGGAAGQLFTINGLTERTVLCHHFACSWHDNTSAYATHADKFANQENVLLRDMVKAQAAISAVEIQSDLITSTLQPENAKSETALHTHILVRIMRSLAFRTRRLRAALYNRSSAFSWLINRGNGL